ncbi:MAG: nucleotidyltransferase domain-containing protein [Promethearchaeota archaeon]
MAQSTESIIKELQNQFSFLKSDPRILGIILYGSAAAGENHLQSDFDICIVAPNHDNHAIYQTIMRHIQGEIDHLDIRFFEELPLLIRADIMEQGIILHSQDLGDLTEYFFFSTRLELDDFRFRIQYVI